MKHYGVGDLVDFARGLLSEPERGEMHRHLRSGCAMCGADEAFYEKLNEVCRGMGPADTPSPVVDRARAVFPLQTPVRRPGGKRLPAILTFDSFLTPSTVGLRSTWQVGWQGLYRAGSCSLDLRIEPELHSSRAAVIGQISDHALPDTRMADVPVCLMAGKCVVAETRSNQFGEFQMEYEQQSRLQLRVLLDGGARRIQVPLKRLAADQGADAARLLMKVAEGKKRGTGGNNT
jgi:hypothetical protein